MQWLEDPFLVHFAESESIGICFVFHDLGNAMISQPFQQVRYNTRKKRKLFTFSALSYVFELRNTCAKIVNKFFFALSFTLTNRVYVKEYP